MDVVPLRPRDGQENALGAFLCFSGLPPMDIDQADLAALEVRLMDLDNRLVALGVICGSIESQVARINQRVAEIQSKG
jgi:hypothetical protein